MGHFYVSYQEAHETIPQFIIWFQNLRRQFARPPPKEDVKDIFLLTLRESLWTTLTIFYFKEQSLE